MNEKVGEGMTRKRKFILLFVVFIIAVATDGCSKKEEPAEEAEDLTINLPGTEFTERSNVSENDTPGESEEQADTKDILICIDPGHQSPEVDMSGQEPNAPGSSVMKTKATGGTVGQYSGVPEYQLNLEISMMLRDELQKQGYEVVMTREDNETAISNAERAVLANESGADFVVRIHANGSENTETNGALVLVGSEENSYVGELYDESFSLGENILNAYCETTGMANLGVQTNDTMTGINWSEVPVIILEMGFMTNRQDDLNMADPEYQKKMVEGIVKGIDAYCVSE